MSSVTQLGYLGIGVSDLAVWERFATQTLGLQNNGHDADGTLFLKMDEYHHRFAMHANGSDDVVYVGWEVADEQALQAMSAAVVGLILVMTARIVRVGLRRRAGLLLGAGTFLLVGPLALPTVAVIALMLAIGLWLNRPRASEALTPRSDTGPRGGE